MKVAVLLALSVLSPVGALAQDAMPAAVSAEIELALLRAAESGGLPGPDEEPLRIEGAARTRYELGAVIDPRAAQGPSVLAVTPGGAAERIGLRVGDRLLAVNGEPLVGAPQPLDVLRDTVSRHDGALALQVGRADRVLSVQGQAAALAVPAFALTVSPSASVGRCGRISTFFTASRSDDLFPATIAYIDGRTPLKTATIRVKPGKRLVTVAEDIDSERFVAVQQRQRTFQPEDHYKTIEIDVQPDTTYAIAAHFNPGGSVVKHEHWNPVVYRETHEACH